MVLSLFPSLLSWGELAPFLIRITIGVVFIHWSYVSMRKELHETSHQSHRLISVLEAICGILLFIGLWTQLAALVVALDLLIRLIQKARYHSFLTNGVNYYLILFIMAVTLLVSGAGFFAFDLPL